MAKDRNWRVTNPDGVPWEVKFSSPASAWSRLLGLKGLPDTARNREAMMEQGWKVEAV